jgi:uncharacterized protein (DUF488 family)
MQQLYTIGHSVHPIDYFLKLLTANDINCVVDVRSIPYSKFAPQYNKFELQRVLKSNGIFYIFMGEEFGARRTDRTLYTPDGYVDFEKVKQSYLFKKGMGRIINGLTKGFNIAFMCKEKEPLYCHRNILVARAFFEQNYKILNILEDGRIESQEELNERLLDIYFPNRNQKTLLEIIEGEKSNEDLIKEAYKIINSQIAYKEEGAEVVVI